jgi:hypothetical protein
MYAVVGTEEVRRFCAPAGTVLFLDSNACFHFGSRRPDPPRFQLQLAYVSPCRSDFGDILRPQLRYPVLPSDPPLRRLVLDREFTG